MKQRIWIALMMAGSMAMVSPGVVMGAEEAATEEIGAEAATEQTEETEETAQSQLGEDLYGFQLQYDGVLYELPMTVEEFTAQGWELSKYEDPEIMVGTNSYTSVGFVKGEQSIRADVINFGINEAALSQCLIGGLSVDGGYTDLDLSATIIELPKGITMGKSNMDDIKAAYGEPTDTYEGDNYVKATYEADYYQDVELYVYKDDNTLRQVSLRNFTEPEGFDKGSVSDEIPEAVTAYKAPTGASETFMEPVVEYFGDFYALPAPVSAFLDNGWTMKDVGEEDFVEGSGLAFIDMMKENQTIHFSVYNMTENAVKTENCFVTELEFATYDPEIISMKLAGGISIGEDKNDLIALAEENGYIYEDDTENGYLTIYRNKESKLDTKLEVWFNMDESETAAAGISYHNEILPE